MYALTLFSLVASKVLTPLTSISIFCVISNNHNRSKQKLISRIANFMSRAFKKSSDQLIVCRHFSSRFVTSLIFISNFCLMKQQLETLETNQQELNSRIVKCVSRVFKQESALFIVCRHFSVVTQ